MEDGFHRNRPELSLVRSRFEGSVDVTWPVRGKLRGPGICRKSQDDKLPPASFEARCNFKHKPQRENVPSHVPVAY